MTDDELRKKSQQAAEEERKRAEELARARETATTQFEEEAAAAESARLAAENARINTVTDLLNQGLGAREAMLTQAQKDVEKAERENKILHQGDLNAAKYTGLTNLATSIANMIGVGEGHAVSQQYHDYSQDWMRKADEDMKQRRARIDNLRERQRAIQQQRDEMKVNNGLTIVQMQEKAAEAQRKERLRKAEAQAKASIDAAVIRAEGQRSASKMELEGEQDQMNYNLRKRGQDISAGQHRDLMEQTYRRYGFEKDPNTGEWKVRAPKSPAVDDEVADFFNS